METTPQPVFYYQLTLDRQSARALLVAASELPMTPRIAAALDGERVTLYLEDADHSAHTLLLVLKHGGKRITKQDVIPGAIWAYGPALWNLLHAEPLEAGLHAFAVGSWDAALVAA
jgi:hypothetical protein